MCTRKVHIITNKNPNTGEVCPIATGLSCANTNAAETQNATVDQNRFSYSWGNAERRGVKYSTTTVQ